MSGGSVPVPAASLQTTASPGAHSGTGPQCLSARSGYSVLRVSASTYNATQCPVLSQYSERLPSTQLPNTQSVTQLFQRHSVYSPMTGNGLALVRMVERETAELGGSPAILPLLLSLLMLLVTLRLVLVLVQPLVTPLLASPAPLAAAGDSERQPLPNPRDGLPSGQSIEWTTHAGHRLPCNTQRGGGTSDRRGTSGR